MAPVVPASFNFEIICLETASKHSCASLAPFWRQHAHGALRLACNGLTHTIRSNQWRLLAELGTNRN